MTMLRRDLRQLRGLVFFGAMFVAHAAFAGDPSQPALPAGDAPSADAPSADDAPGKEEARTHFDKGVALLQARSFDAALIEFERSRAAFPTRSATENAAVCLREVGRLDEAYDAFGKVLNDFGEIPDDVKKRIEDQRTELESHMGGIKVSGGESGASVTVDGRQRGTLPLAAPIRAGAGVHVVRVHLDGYVPFVQAVDVVPTKNATVAATLEVLARAGRLRVADRRGRALEVVVDGVTVGTTPWEGALAPGDHAVWLHGAFGVGTVPRRGRVIVGQKTDLVLNAIDLDATVAVSVTPPIAIVSIDGVVVGAGAWEGKMPSGDVTVAVSATGYQAETRQVRVPPNGRATLDFDLHAAQAVHEDVGVATTELGLRGSFAIAPIVLGEPCTDACSTAIGLGVDLEATALYRFPIGLAVGGGVGFLRLNQGADGRPVTVDPPGRPAQSAKVDEDVVLSGATAALIGSYRLGSSPFFGVDLGAGIFAGAAGDSRTIAATDSTGATYSAGPYYASGTVVGFVGRPELRLGFVAAGPLELWLGAGAILFVPIVAPTFDYAAPIPAGADGAAHLASSPMLGDFLGAFSTTAGVGLRL